MDWQKIIELLLTNLSWPITIIILVFILRNKLRNIVNFKAKDYEISFLNEVKSIKKDVEKHSQLMKKTDWKVTSTRFLRDNKISLAEKTPVAAVLQAWSIMEQTVVECALHKGFSNYSSPAAAVQYLSDKKFLYIEYLNIYFRLFALKESFTNFEGEIVSKERALEASDTILDMAEDIRDYITNYENKEVVDNKR